MIDTNVNLMKHDETVILINFDISGLLGMLPKSEINGFIYYTIEELLRLSFPYINILDERLIKRDRNIEKYNILVNNNIVVYNLLYRKLYDYIDRYCKPAYGESVYLDKIQINTKLNNLMLKVNKIGGVQ